MAAFGSPYQAIIYYVKTTGSDSTGTGTFTNPWATVGHAVAALKANGIFQSAWGDIVINVSTGTYSTTATIPIDMTCARPNGRALKIVSIDGPGTAVLNGGTPVAGWVVYSGSIYRAAVSGSFWTIYENGIRARSARLPAYSLDASHVTAMAPYFTSLDPGSQPNLNTLKYNNSDFDPSTWTVADLQAVTWSGGSIAWMTDTTPVTSRDTTNKLFGLASQTKFCTYGNPGAGGSRYFMQGDLSMLTGPGQWYYDRTDAHGSPGGGQHYLYYWPNNTPIASQDIRIPLVGQIFSLTGQTVSNRVTNVTIDGFGMTCTDFVQTMRWGYPYDGTNVLSPPPPPTHADPPYAYFLSMPYARTGAVYLKNCDNVTVQNCHINGAGMHGVYAEGFGQALTIQRNWIEHVGHSGVVLEGGYPSEGDYMGSNLISDNRINNVGELYGGASAIDIIQSGNNTIQYLDLHDGPRKAVWLRGEDSVGLTWVYTRGNLVQYAKVQRFCQDSGDTGAVGCTGFSSINTPSGPWNTNTFNQIAVDSISAHASMIDAAPNGVFTDDQTNGQTFQNVQVTNTQGAQFRANGTDATTHTLTNTSFKSDGTANGAFNAGLMDTANIGTTGAFPYP